MATSKWLPLESLSYPLSGAKMETMWLASPQWACKDADVCKLSSTGLGTEKMLKNSSLPFPLPSPMRTPIKLNDSVTLPGLYRPWKPSLWIPSYSTFIGYSPTRRPETWLGFLRTFCKILVQKNSQIWGAEVDEDWCIPSVATWQTEEAYTDGPCGVFSQWLMADVANDRWY